MKLINHVTMSISVLDVNDNPPVFIQTTYIGTVSESAELYTSVLEVHATNLDTGVMRLCHTLWWEATIKRCLQLMWKQVLFVIIYYVNGS